MGQSLMGRVLIPMRYVPSQDNFQCSGSVHAWGHANFVYCNDADRDGIAGILDNCPSEANPSQSDKNGNGIGDV